MKGRPLSNMGWRSFFFIAAICNSILMGCQGQVDPAPIPGPQISGVDVSRIWYYDAVLSASITGLTEGISCGFELKNETVGSTTVHSATPSSDNIITLRIKNLQNDTYYSARAFADNGGTLRVYSQQTQFKTLPAPQSTDVVPIPDPEFKKWLLFKYDLNDNSELEYSEAEKAQTIEISTDNITSISGIEHLPNLKELDACGTVKTLDLWYGLLSEIDLSRNKNLNRIKVIANNLAHIDPQELTQLNFLEISFNPLQEIHIQNLKGLSYFACSHTYIKTCDLGGLDNLKEVHMDNNKLLETVTLRNNRLEYLDLYSCSLKELDIRECPALRELDIHDNPNLHYVYITNNQRSIKLINDSHIEFIYDEQQ